jgi:hypothetical protein
MSFYGNLRTMSLPDLLQWASVNHKTGILELERNKICKRIGFRDGRIIACSSEDPPALLGQFLLSRGKIDRETLRESLARQEVCGDNLGSILEEMGALSREEIESQVALKAEENIYGLFDWTDAVFRFLENAPLDPYTIEVNLSVEDVLMRGAQRHDELQRIRTVLRNSGVVLRRTDRAAPREIMGSPMARRILDSIDGERTIAEVLLHAHASEFLVIKLLFMLHHRGVVEIGGERPVDPESATLLDASQADTTDFLGGEQDGDGEDRPGPEEDQADEIEKAHRMMSEGDYAAALDILDACYRARPDDNYLRHLMLQAESGYLQSSRTGELAPARIPVVVQTEVNPVESNLQPNELFLLSMLDGQTDIKSLSWVAPLREVDLLRALQRMLDEGLIQMCDQVSAADEDAEDAPIPAVQWSPF